MKKILVVMFALVVGTSAYAAGSGMYFGVDVSYDMMTFERNNVENDRNNIGIGLNLGKAFPAINGDIRPEIAFTYALEDDNYSYYEAMFNLYYDIEITNGVYIYPTVGIGMRFHEWDVAGNTWDDDTFTWQAGFGMRFHMTEQGSVDVTARYVNSGEPNDIKDTGYKIGMGFKYWF